MKFWPFRNKHVQTAGAKSASYLFGMGALKQMQLRYETFATEGYGLNPVVRACVDKIASAVTAVDIQAYTKSKDGKTTEIENHPVLQLLNKPNPTMTGEEFLGDLVRYYLIAGNAFVNGTGIDPMLKKPQPPKELHLFKPGCVKIIAGPGNLPFAYEYTKTDMTKIVYPVNQLNGMSAVMHKKTFNPTDNWMGLSPMTAAAFGIDVINEGDKWNLRLLQNEGRPCGALVLKGSDGKPQTLTPEQYNRLKEQLEQQYSGSNNAGRPFLLEGGLEWQEMSLNAKDMDHEKNMNKAARSIALVYGVPPMLLGIPGDNTYSNMAEAKLAFWTDTVLPLLKSVLGSLNNWLEPMYGDGMMLWYDEEMIPALEPMRKEMFARLQSATFLSDNEKRAAAGYDDMAGADTLFIDANKIPLKLAGEMDLVEPGSEADKERAKQ